MTAQALSVNQFIDEFDVGRTTTYQEIKSGRLRTYLLGKRRYISRAAAEEWQQSLERETAAAMQTGEPVTAAMPTRPTKPARKAPAPAKKPPKPTPKVRALQPAQAV
jgi:hypothetical protein